jgi:ribosomal protein S27E
MNRLQKFILSLMPKTWADAAEADSRAWMMKCGACGHEQSVWDAGGIRWKAVGNSRNYRRCIKCRAFSWQRLSRKAPG